MNRKPKVIFELHGGIGNQLFQFVAAITYAKKTNCELRFDITHILPSNSTRTTLKSRDLPLALFGLLDYQIIGGRWELFFEKFLRKMPMLKNYYSHHVMSPRVFTKSFESKEIGFDVDFLNSFSKRYFGYFQTHKYCSDSIRENLTVKILSRKEPTWVMNHLAEISSDRVLLLHARFFQQEIENTYLTLNSNYYLNAIEVLGGEDSFSQIWLLTNDVSEAESTLHNVLLSKVKLLDPPEFVDDLSILHLMVAARNLVIANSTFSWWGAYLGAQDKRVVAPKEIFQSKAVPRDYYPLGWIQTT